MKTSRSRNEKRSNAFDMAFQAKEIMALRDANAALHQRVAELETEQKKPCIWTPPGLYWGSGYYTTECGVCIWTLSKFCPNCGHKVEIGGQR